MAVADKTRVLIVDDIAETRENLKRMLQFDQSIEVVGIARTGREAIDNALQIKPDVVLMDINMPDMDGIAATEAIHKRNPVIQVVILSVQSDPNYMRRAMLAGARDFLSKPPMIDELTSAIKRAGQMAADERAKAAISGVGAPGTPQAVMHGGSETGKIITVYSPKGGTGATMVAVNLAIAMNTSEKKVVLVDANLQFGDVPAFLNEPVKNTVLDLTPRVDDLDNDVVNDVVSVHSASQIGVLVGPNRPELAEKVSGEDFGKLLQYLRKVYKYIIVDTASYLTDTVQGALEVTDLIILVTTQEFPSIKNANQFLSLTDAVGIKRDQILFVMNKYNKQNPVSPEKIGERLHQPIVLTIPQDDRIVPSSVIQGVPFMIDNKNSIIGKSILQLADLVNDRLKVLDSVDTPASPRK